MKDRKNSTKENTADIPASSTEINIFEETHDINAYNLQQLLKATGMLKKDLAKQLQVSPATVTAWMTPSSSYRGENSVSKGKESGPNLATPPVAILKRIRDIYNISIDDFSTKRLKIYEHGSFSKVAPSDVQKYQWYTGTYYCYYFDTSSHKGRDNKPDFQALCYGLLHIYEVVSPISGSDFKAISIFGLKSPEKMLEIAEYLRFFESPDDVDQLLNDYERTQLDNHRLPIAHFSRYFGDLEITDLHIFMNLRYREKDSASLVFNKPFGHKPAYYGGIGTINSVSRGADPCPCIQYMGISRAPLRASPEEICHNLLIGMPRVKAPEETEQMIALCKSLVEHQLGLSEKDGFYTLSDSQLYLTIKAQLEAKLTKAVERNLFRCVRISRRDDNDWYHFIKPDVEAAWMDVPGGDQYDDKS